MKLPSIASILLAFASIRTRNAFTRALDADPLDEPVDPSPDLTLEELALLDEMKSVDAHKSLRDLLEKTQNELDRLKRIQNEEIPKFLERRRLLSDGYEERAQETREILELIQTRNQADVLSFMKRVQNVIQEELDRRAKMPDLESAYDETIRDEWSDKVTISDVRQQFDLQHMSRVLSETLGSDVLDILYEKTGYVFVEYLQECQDRVERKKNALENEMSEILRQHEAGHCVKTVDVALQIIQSLEQLEKDEKQNDALVGAKIVYGGKWTSDTFQPKLETTSDEELKLGDLQLRKYIPQDWERLLPSGWKGWDISIFQKIKSSPSPQNILPAYFWHSLPSRVVSIVESPFEKGIPAPVETVMDPNMNLGSCWKMAGRNGRVTFHLDRPMVIDSITIDHYPWLISAHNSDEYLNHVTSAPRFMRVIGYPSCDSNDTECRDLTGFNADRPIYFNSFEYKIDTSLLKEDEFTEDEIPINSSQTFKLSPVSLLPDDDDDESEQVVAACDAVSTTCDDAGHQGIDAAHEYIEALTLTVDVNWGHPDYTCLYRVRVNERV